MQFLYTLKIAYGRHRKYSHLASEIYPNQGSVGRKFSRDFLSNTLTSLIFTGFADFLPKNKKTRDFYRTTDSGFPKKISVGRRTLNADISDGGLVERASRWCVPQKYGKFK